MSEFVNEYLKRSIQVKQSLAADNALITTIDQTIERIITAYNDGNKVLVAGNGGSAADAQHLAAELVSRFYFDRPGLPAIALSTDTSMLTAISNDYGYEQVFSRQVQAQGKPGDVFIGISTSGNSANIIQAVSEAKKGGLTTVALCGRGGQLKDLCDIVLSAPSTVTPYIQECHICLAHIICAAVEEQLFSHCKP